MRTGDRLSIRGGSDRAAPRIAEGARPRLTALLAPHVPPNLAGLSRSLPLVTGLAHRLQVAQGVNVASHRARHNVVNLLGGAATLDTSIAVAMQRGCASPAPLRACRTPSVECFTTRRRSFVSCMSFASILAGEVQPDDRTENAAYDREIRRRCAENHSAKEEAT